MIDDMSENTRTGLEIAIIGMAGRFPGAKNIDEFWDNLKNGKETTCFFSDKELEEAGIDKVLLTDSYYVKARGYLAEVECFDAAFFGYTPKEAEMTDPQVRILHECCWEALENAGYEPGSYPGLIGLYTGASSGFYWEVLSLLRGQGSASEEQFAALTLKDKDFSSMRISYRLDLKGPSYTIYTACSTSLVAVDAGCRGLLTGQCDMVLAGGVSLFWPLKTGYLFQEGMIKSPDGHCRAFDARSKGAVFGEGVGIVVLKVLEDAIANKDCIHAVIKGSAVNNDGIGKVGFTAPGIRGQVEVIREALQMARVNPETIGYVETHGTGTSLGDPIEIDALKQAFNTGKRGFCGIGSVKTNVGHLDTAAGAAGLIKTVLALKHREIPPILHFESPNPKIDFENSPFYVVTGLCPWKSTNCLRRAGVSSFGFGGTNAHVILEEWPQAQSAERKAHSEARVLFLLSAKTEVALERMTQNLAEYLKKNPGINLADAAYTLQVGRKAFKYRRMLVARDVNKALSELSSPGSTGVVTSAAPEDKRPVVFMFSGQGSQYVNMGRELYETEPVFREEMDRCFEILNGLMDDHIKEILYPGEMHNRSYRSNTSYKSYKSYINQTEIAQPLLFIFEYALGRMLMKWGIRPYAMMGHSIGEYTAACLSGVFSLEDALRLVVLRGKLMQQMDGGAMLSVPLPEDRLVSLLPPNLSLAAVNGPSLCVVSGSHQAIAAFAGTLKQKGYETRPLHTSHAFHSEMMTPVQERFREQVDQVCGNPPGIPFISNVTGKWLTGEQAINPGYWADHLRKTVRFFDGLGQLLSEENAVLLEVGPGKGLSTFARQHPRKNPGQLVLHLVRHPQENVTDRYFLMKQTGQLWLHGINILWKEYHSHQELHRLPLPTYPFEKQRFPVETRILPEHFKEGVSILPGGSSPGKPRHMDHWFYIPTWKQYPFTGCVDISDKTRDQPGWLLFMDECGIGSQLVKHLGKDVVIVKAGERFARTADGAYTVNPGEENNFAVLLDELSALDKPAQRIVYLWGITPTTDPGAVFYSLLYLVKAIGSGQVSGEIQLEVVTDNMQAVTGEEVLCPEKAAVMAACKVIHLEYPHITCRSIDMAFPRPGGREAVLEKSIRQLALEMVSQAPDPVVAWRGPHRWVQGFEPIHLDKPDKTPSRLREQGVYLITGGLGGIGLVLAENLAKTIGARLILTGRRFFPARQDWEKWLSTHDNHDPTAFKIRKLQEIEELGGEVLVIRADAADRQEMAAAVNQARSRFGRIDGVIHAAGLPDGKLIQARTRALTEQVLAPKVKGTLVLEQIFKDESLDFFILCSSLNSLLGAVGQVAYCAANAFLDAFALQKNGTGPCLTVSIGWDAWQEVGMAVESAKKMPGSAPEVKHPLLNRRLTGADEGGDETYISHLSASRHWVLKDHMVMGKPTLPGTACLEMARAAFENLVGQQQVEIRDVIFLTPMALEANEERETRTILKKQPGFYEFFILSSPEPIKDQWSLHARGKISGIPGDDKISRKYDIEAIKIRCAEAEKIVSKEEYESAPGFLTLGPRWTNVKAIKFGLDEGLARLELDETFAPDLHTHMMHPALLDNATAFMSGKVKDSGAYLPISYKKLKVKGRLPRRFFSYSQYKPGVSPGKHTLEFDLTLMDESGLERISIAGYTLMAVSRDASPAPVSFASFESITGSPLPGQEKAKEKVPGHGILSSEGVEVFQRILNSTLPRVLVSTRDLHRRMEKMKKDRAAEAPDSIKKAASPSRVYPRPELTTSYVPPQNETQQILADILQEFIGIEKVGIHDDFFELGGDSLKALTIVSEIHKRLNIEIPLGEIFNSPTVEKLFRYTENAGRSKFSGMKPVEEKEYYLLSSAQKRLFILDQLESDSTGYNLSDAVLIEGKLETKRLPGIFKKLAARHESLRTCFHMMGDEPVQRTHKEVDSQVEYYDLVTEKKPFDPKSQELRAKSYIKNFIRPFDLSCAPLLRVGLIQLEKKKHILVVDMHHIITDGTSYNIFESEFMMLYRGESLPGLRFRYRDYARWQVNRERKHRQKKEEEFWLREFNEDIPPLNLPIDYSRPAIQGFEGRHVNFKIGEEGTRKIKSLALEHDVTVYMVLFAAYNVLLSKLANQEKIVVGTPAAGRNHTDVQQIIGMFINTLALKSFPQGEKTFHRYLIEVKETTLQAFEHQDYPFEDLVEKVKVKRDISRNPLFDVMFVFYNMESPVVNMPGVKLTPYEYEDNISKFDLTLQAVESENILSFTFEYGTNLFKEDTIRRLIRYFKQTISFLVENPAVKLWEVKILSEEEENQLLFDFNQTAAAYPGDKTIHELFAELVERTPDRIAVVGARELPEKGTRGLAPLYISCRELNGKADQLAHILIEKGVQPDTIVGIMTDRSVEMIIGILGILKSGAAYLPIDPEYPEERIKYMLKDSGAKILLSAGRHLDLPSSPLPSFSHLPIFPSSQLPSFSHLHLTPTPATSLAYIIYTSGTTGKPKGVLVEHGNVVAYLWAFYQEFEMMPGDTILQLASYSFDVFVEEVFPILVKGGKIVIPGLAERNDIDLLSRFIDRHQVSIIDCTPLLLNEFNKFHRSSMSTSPGDQLLKSVHTFISGGDVLKKEYVDHLLKIGKVYNTYGPTETTVCAAYYHLEDPGIPGAGGLIVPIGKPICNYMIYILDSHHQLLPIGVAGELCISGDGVTRGYLNRPELTCEKFKIINYKLKIKNGSGALRADLNAFGEDTNKNKKVPGKRNDSHMSDMSHMSYIYKTGDLARWMADGNIEFLGRKDHQVKIRGFRIELAEIEYRLMKHEEIKEAVVVVRQDEDSNKFLCAYYIPVEKSKDKDYDNRDGAHGDQKVQIGTLREFLDRGLPDYMIPSYFVPMERFPLTSNKKIDRESLPDPDGYWARKGTTYLAPQTDLEKKIAQCWKKVLKKDKIGIYDNFFELGGNSLNIIRLTNELKIALGSEIPVVSLYRYLTISSFARHLKEQQSKTLVHGNERLPNQPVEALRRSKKVLKHTVQKTVGVRHARKK